MNVKSVGHPIQTTCVILKIMGAFWLQIILRHLIFEGTKRDTNFGNFLYTVGGPQLSYLLALTAHGETKTECEKSRDRSTAPETSTPHPNAGHQILDTPSPKFTTSKKSQAGPTSGDDQGRAASVASP